MKKVLTIVLDGFGIRDEEHGNAVKAAKMKNFENLFKEYPSSLLEASGEYVGLQPGQFGNSEVGHMTIGAGRLVKQNEIIVDEFLAEGYLENETFKDLMTKKGKKVHIIGLASDGNVHAGIDDFVKMHNILVKNGFDKIFFHLMTDGRDTGLTSALGYVEMIEKEIEKHKVGHISTLSGRYFGMDRDKNYNRTKEYYDLIVRGRAVSFIDLKRAIESSYNKGITDEFIKPLISDKFEVINDGDVVIWMNYRADRAKQIMFAITDPNFEEFNTKTFEDLEVYSFFPIDEKLNIKNFLEPIEVKNAMGLYLSELEIEQARVAESEKFPHVTYFFDGGYDGKIPGCHKFNIPSPEVETFDLKPEMSIVGVTKQTISLMKKDYDFILVNFANPDMVGHTGNYEAAVEACMAVDVCLDKLIEEADANFYTVIVVADHGNAEDMIYENGEPRTSHTTSAVPFIIRDKKVELVEKGDLTMVAPTILTYMDIAVPKEMEETPLLLKNID